MTAKITVAKVTKALALIFATDPAELELLSELEDFFELELFSGVELLFEELEDFFELELLSEELELLSVSDSSVLELLTGSSSFVNDVMPQNPSSS